MARPRKQTVDYFPHNCKHGKTVYILEQRYQAKGYAFWFKLLEEIGGHDGHFIDINSLEELEFLCAKTWFTEEEILEVLDLLAKLNAIDAKLWKNKIIWCQNFVNNISDVYNKRIVSVPEKPVSVGRNPKDKKVSDVGKPQSKVKESKVKESKVIASIARNDINPLIKEFEEINPNISYGNKTQRQAMIYLVDKYGLEKTKSMIQAAVRIQGEKFAPVITTPYQLKEKLSQLIIYYQKESKSTNKYKATMI